MAFKRSRVRLPYPPLSRSLRLEKSYGTAPSRGRARFLGSEIPLEIPFCRPTVQQASRKCVHQAFGPSPQQTLRFRVQEAPAANSTKGAHCTREPPERSWGLVSVDRSWASFHRLLGPTLVARCLPSGSRDHTNCSSCGSVGFSLPKLSCAQCSFPAHSAATLDRIGPPHAPPPEAHFANVQSSRRTSFSGRSL